ncbi:TonB-dependent receptor family protein [Emcibacter sp.]|uniref:TonB-dependent receptor family protein n=1 Tax=Emcibacter sp. TaxID=1979954 RepID=UPI002AA90C6E|nr:TonB-dependent receptor [Emcibacter sp.]
MKSVLYSGVASMAVGITLTGNVSAAEATFDTIDGMERIQVIGKSSGREKIPGSALRLGKEDLEVFKYEDILRTLRLVPGVNIQEEDGYGLRPNIGLRGSGVERSAKITLMEDGVLIAPAPYAAPSAYYFPTTARMEAIEVRKGSAAVKFGPRTVGGAINLVSRSIPEEFSGFADGRIGEDGLYTLHGAIGGSGDHVSGVAEFFHSENDGFKHLPNGADTGFEVTDFMGKLRISSDEEASVPQSLEFKVSKTDGDSNETYLGLTDADFAADPYQRYAASALDNIDTDHQQFQVTHTADFGGVQVVTVAYYNEFERDWFKFQDIRNATVSSCGSGSYVLANPVECVTELAWLKGEADSAEGAIRIRHNARSYEAKGIQSLVAIPFETGTADHDLEFSVRYHEDFEDRLQYHESFTMIDGQLVYASEDEIGSAGNRLVSANAWAFFAQDTISAGNWTIVPGVRFERIRLNRSDWAAGDADRTGARTDRDETRVDAFIPGIGISYRVNDGLTLTGGLYKGFNPPGAGSADAIEETSLNIELGFVYKTGSFYMESMAFYSDYDNILGTCTASVGCEAGEIGDQFNGGNARILGLELVGGYDIDAGDGWTVPLQFNYTYTDAEFSSSFDSEFWGDVADGDDFPYLSEHQLTLSVGVAHERFSATAQVNYVSESRARAGSGDIPADEKIDGRVVVDLSAHYQLVRNVELFASLHNLLDEVYSVARRPIGLRPGKPRTAVGGVKVSF